MNESKFVWNDGGRAASGDVGLAGDCVTRAISIATGMKYKTVYNSLKEIRGKTPRNGVSDSEISEYLSALGWQFVEVDSQLFSPAAMPGGVVIAMLRGSKQGGHACTVIDGVIHDTWNPCDDGYTIVGYWLHPSGPVNTSDLISASKLEMNESERLTQVEFEKVLSRIRKLQNTAKNHASTEAEQHNALRMMQHLLLKNNLSESDIDKSQEMESVGFTKIACPVNGMRVCVWESVLARYITDNLFPAVQYYRRRQFKRTLFFFYGPRLEVVQAIEIFRELILSIATQARLLYRGYARGSGSSYALGYACKLPRSCDDPTLNTSEEAVVQNALVANRSLKVCSSATEWLERECDIKLRSFSTSDNSIDHEAYSLGAIHGASHEVNAPNRPKRLSCK